MKSPSRFWIIAVLTLVLLRLAITVRGGAVSGDDTFLLNSCGDWWYHGDAATLAGIILILGAVILFSLGIISEYLCRILDETRKRPPFVVERVIAPRVDIFPTDLHHAGHGPHPPKKTSDTA